jgi:hypothetical protein
MMRYRPIKAEPNDSKLGRYIPDRWDHIAKWSFRSVAPHIVDQVEKILVLPYWHKRHDQGEEGSCVGHAIAMERAITNTSQNRFLNIIGFKSRWYDPLDIWELAKEKYDEWEETKAGDDNGTSVHAGYDVARIDGIIRVKKMVLGPTGKPIPVGSSGLRDKSEGVEVVRWAQNSDEIRTAISEGKPVVIGVNWYSEASRPEKFKKEYWIGRNGFTRLDGGHCVCIYGASDRRQAFKIKNNWYGYPLVWMPYSEMDRLLLEYGEAALVTDR